jgi:hypothetical protein
MILYRSGTGKLSFQFSLNRVLTQPDSKESLSEFFTRDSLGQFAVFEDAGAFARFINEIVYVIYADRCTEDLDEFIDFFFERSGVAEIGRASCRERVS